MKIYITFTKGKTVVLFALVILLIAVGVRLSAAANKNINGVDNPSRISFISNLGLNAEDTYDEKEITIPMEFSDVYKRYNSVQIEAGFNLEKYKGKKATVYSYREKDTDRIINLIVCNGEIIGGDISGITLDGIMLPIKSKNQS